MFVKNLRSGYEKERDQKVLRSSEKSPVPESGKLHRMFSTVNKKTDRFKNYQSKVITK